MNPQNPTMPTGPEPAPNTNQNPESLPVPTGPEGAPAGSPAPSGGQPAPVAPVVPGPTTPPTVTPANPAAPTPTATPVLADDVDVIEKEWVDAADQVIKTTKEDPHKEEEAFENLQVDYLKKRYGKDIKKPEDK